MSRNKVELDGIIRWCAHRRTKTNFDISNVRLTCTGESGYPATVDCDFWNELAVQVQHLTKGDHIVCEGEVRNKRAAHKEGKWQVVVNITKIHRIEKLVEATGKAPAAAEIDEPEIGEDDLPF